MTAGAASGLAGLPPALIGFAATVALSFVIGLELHSYRRGAGETPGRSLGFGTTRTLTLIGVAGFVLWRLDAVQPLAFPLGLGALALWLALDYRARLARGEESLLPTLVALLVFTLAPLMLTEPAWLVAAVAITALLMLGEKPGIRRFSDAFPAAEGVSLAKFLILAGLVLPLLPAAQIPGLPGITYAKIWLAVVLISGISYLGYLAHTYFFPRAGLLLTGVLGGLYSSTAATVVLARAARSEPACADEAAAAVVIATAMMYLRLWVLIFILGHQAMALRLAAPFALALAGAAPVTWALARRGRGTAAPPSPRHVTRNPLDLPIALLFAALFVAFAAITRFIVGRYGAGGLHVLSFAVGFTDVDPFILSLLAGNFHVGAPAVEAAILVASGSNNLLKAGYALALSHDRRMLPAALWLAALCAASLGYAWLAPG